MAKGSGNGKKAEGKLRNSPAPVGIKTRWAIREVGVKGGQVNPRLKQLMKELGEAINESLSESEQIAEVIAKIKAGGYDVFLVLEATIGFNKRDEQPAAENRPWLAPGASPSRNSR